MLTQYETNRLVIKVLTSNYCNSVLRFYKDNKNIFEPLNPISPTNYYTTNYQRSVLMAEYEAYLKGNGIRYYIYEKTNSSKIIGTVSFSDIKGSFSKSAILGYRFGKKYHHQGFAAEAIQELIKAVKKEGYIHRLEAYIQPENIPSKNLIIRLGFNYEGICYSHTLIQEKWKDMERYSLILS